MSFFDAMLRRLDDEQIELAKTSLAQPQGRDAFEYGRVAGMYAGFSRARELIVDLVDEKDQRDNDL